MAALLEARDVGFAYGPGLPDILAGCDVRIERGTTTALTGPSGRGKSTLLYLLGLMVRPTRGEVLLDGRRVDDTSDVHRARLRAHDYGFVFQDAVLDPTRTVLHNILEGALYRGEDARTAQARARTLMERFGVDLPAGRRPGQISGGQAQRIALCRALLGAPAVILADEPTGNLDVETAQTVLRAFEEHARDGGSVVIVTHDLHLAGLCDRRVEL